MSISSLALPLSIASILVLVRFKVPVALGVLVGCILLIALVIPIGNLPSLILETATNQQTWELFIVVPCTLAFASIMGQKGLLTRLADALESIGPRAAVHLLPAVIGLVPMPAGALVAATAEGKLAEKLKLKPENIAFINYWFRHIWEFSMPFYPMVVVASTMSSIPLSTVVRTLFPFTILAVILGAIVSYRMLRNTPPVENKTRDSLRNILLSLVKAAWPVLLLIILIFTKIDAWIVFPAVLLLVMLQQRVNWSEIKKALKQAFEPWMLLLLLAVMLYQTTAKNTNSTSVLISQIQSLGFPPVFLLAAIPLVVGLAVGYGPATAGISVPLMLPYIINNTGIHPMALLVVCVSGEVGQLLSPAHLCFCLSVEYFKTTLSRVYRSTIPILLVIELAAVLAYVIFN